MEKLSCFFEKSIKSDNSKCKSIRGYSIFSVLKSRADEEAKKKKKKSHWNAFNLLPNEEYGDYEASMYAHKAIAMMAANNDRDLYIKLYEEVPESEVWDFLAVNSAVNYTPPMD